MYLFCAKHFIFVHLIFLTTPNGRNIIIFHLQARKLSNLLKVSQLVISQDVIQTQICMTPKLMLVSP